ncbi:rhodanese-like domain-containing protein [Jonesia quinghaiensis]|uniref:rhodanese-like domain-containing protein n=1 Tax=Jonesia quinghaiensis TaxID=262806 RepID=UPI0003F9C2EE|nr:rhodanese-like domain-containing protein [Jonesia quinghaiensis]
MRTLPTLLAALTLLIGASSCSTTPGEQMPATSPTITVTSTTVLVDVRTAEEWATGHLDGAELLDFTSGEFAAAIPTLDADADYVVYCRSGNRAEQAIALLNEAGINQTVNAGSVEEASAATGIDIVTN